MLIVKSNIVVGEARGVEPYGEKKIRVRGITLYGDVLWPKELPRAMSRKIGEWKTKITICDPEGSKRGSKYLGCVLDSYLFKSVEHGNVLVEDAILCYEESRTWFNYPQQAPREEAPVTP